MRNSKKLEYKCVNLGGAYFVHVRKHWWQRWRKEISPATNSPLVLYGNEALYYFYRKLDPKYVKAIYIVD